MLADEIGGNARFVPFDKIEKYMVEVDIVITATSSPNFIITEKMAEKVMKVRKENLLVIDIALPRDVENSVGEIDGVMLYTIDDLREISRENLIRRMKEAEKAEKIVKKELDHLIEMLKELKARNAICAMYSHANLVKNEEIVELYHKLKSKYNIDERALPIIESFANSLIKKYLRKPTVRMKIAARNGGAEIIDAVEYLFGGDSNGVPENKNEKVEKGKIESLSQREQAVKR